MSGWLSWHSGVWNRFRYSDGGGYQAENPVRPYPYFRTVSWNGRMAEQCADLDSRRKGDDFNCNLYS